MALEYSSGWWVPVMRGVLALIFGILALFLPALNLTAVLFLLGLYFIADGLLNIWLAAVLGHVRGGSSRPALIGVLDLALVAAFFLWPGLTAPALSLMIAAWAIITGAGETAGAVSVRTGVIASDWPLYTAGVLLIVLGAVLAAISAAGLYVLLKTLGVFFIVYGLAMAAVGYRERSLSRGRAL